MDSLPERQPPLDPRVMEALKRAGFSPARVEAAMKMQRESGLSPQEYLATLRGRAEKAQEEVDKSKQGWGTPVLAGFVGVLLAQGIWDAIIGRPVWSALSSLVGTAVIVAMQFDLDCLPPRRRLIGGILIGAAVAVLLLAVPGLL